MKVSVEIFTSHVHTFQVGAVTCMSFGLHWARRRI